MDFEVEYYHTDLFRALIDENNKGSKGHPVFSALLYVFCPMAAKWWLDGVVPVVPYDPVWEAASDFASGVTLKESLEKKGVPDLVGHVKKYVEEVAAYRNHATTNYRGSELSPTFTGGKIEVTARTGYQAVFNRYFGGDWRNVLRYSRAWAFTIHDWRGLADIQPGKEKYEFTRISVAFGVPGLGRRSLEWPAWAWKVENGYAFRIVLGMMVNGDIQDHLRFALAARSVGQFVPSREGDKEKREIQPWKVVPHMYSLERQFGYARPYQPRLDIERLVAAVPDLATIAEKGSRPPLGVLSQETKCRYCGFKGACFTTTEEVSPFIYKTISEDAAKLDRVIV